ncbi:hypothetical protein ACRYI5_01130 [Furfurilactobacillus sp. WILCCON 0119]
MDLITRGTSNWDKILNDYLSREKQVFTWTGHHPNGYIVTAKRIGNTVMYSFSVDNNRKQVKGWVQFTDAGFIPAGFRPTTNNYLTAESAPGIIDGKPADWASGFLVVNPDGSLATRAFVIPSAVTDNPDSSWVNAKGTAITSDDYPASN